jgi:hypothetical protein
VAAWTQPPTRFPITRLVRPAALAAEGVAVEAEVRGTSPWPESLIHPGKSEWPAVEAEEAVAAEAEAALPFLRS